MTSSSRLRPPSAEELEQIRPLNRLFLGYLQDRARRKEDCLGLPAPARPLLLAASGEQLDVVAQFPRALFALSLDGEPTAGVMDLSAAESMRYVVDITILLCAWNFARDNVCQARFLLALDSRAIQRLRALQIAELGAWARRPELLRCAFADTPWFWTELLTVRNAEHRRKLALIALQPGSAAVAARPDASTRSI